MKEFKGRSKQRGFFAIAALGLSSFETIALGVGVASAAMSYSSGQSAASAAEQQAAAQQQQATSVKEANAAQQRSANVQTQQERLRQVREARIARARVLSSGINAGMGVASTGISGGVSSITSQMGANIGTINQTQTFASQTAAAQQQAADFGSQAAMFGAKAQANQAEAAQWQQLSGLGFSAADKLGAWDKIMGPAVQPAVASTARTVGTTEFMSSPSIFKMG